ncbi:hypothetical protein PGT21_002649 [Puccinia graminis f. sp. tritici]|uniref:Uncharacterized protein n=1 Tax=Puccinia graminis f. sp. tritici TaxID=56615 RepID=A0A5B0RWI9_PUCGR|nr:hypothetical protein PGT21_002649 [Puccinia graminis f. sp. tritici]KAA1129977.1 hypothetical protein PGTUg99_005073 [Puccinia graminis f. sp. tritici]
MWVETKPSQPLGDSRKAKLSMREAGRADPGDKAGKGGAQGASTNINRPKCPKRSLAKSHYDSVT